MELVPLFHGADDFSTNIAMIRLEEHGIQSIPITAGKVPYKTGLRVKYEDYEKAMEFIKDWEIVDKKFFY